MTYFFVYLSLFHYRSRIIPCPISSFRYSLLIFGHLVIIIFFNILLRININHIYIFLTVVLNVLDTYIVTVFNGIVFALSVWFILFDDWIVVSSHVYYYWAYSLIIRLFIRALHNCFFSNFSRVSIFNIWICWSIWKISLWSYHSQTRFLFILSIDWTFHCYNFII